MTNVHLLTDDVERTFFLSLESDVIAVEIIIIIIVVVVVVVVVNIRVRESPWVSLANFGKMRRC